MALTDEEFPVWCQRNKIEPETITYIHRIRSSDAWDHGQMDQAKAQSEQELQTSWEVVGGERK